jgi:hypothetical protein
MPTTPTISQACIAELRTRGPLDAEELGKLLARTGVTNAKDPAMSVRNAVRSPTSGVLLRGDGRYVSALQLLERNVLTHRYRLGPDRWGHLAAGEDLAPLAKALTAPAPLASGGEVRSHRGWAPALIGPPGWLSDYEDGDLLAFRFVDGHVVIERTEVAAEAPGYEARLAAALSWRHLHDGWRWTYDVGLAVLQLLVEEPRLLGVPMTPLGEIARREGLVRNDRGYDDRYSRTSYDDGPVDEPPFPDDDYDEDDLPRRLRLL